MRRMSLRERLSQIDSKLEGGRRGDGSAAVATPPPPKQTAKVEEVKKDETPAAQVAEKQGPAAGAQKDAVESRPKKSMSLRELATLSSRK